MGDLEGDGSAGARVRCDGWLVWDGNEEDKIM